MFYGNRLDGFQLSLMGYRIISDEENAVLKARHAEIHKNDLQNFFLSENITLRKRVAELENSLKPKRKRKPK